MHVLITGAGGHLGRKLFDTLELLPGYTVSGIDIRPVNHSLFTQLTFLVYPIGLNTLRRWMLLSTLPVIAILRQLGTQQ